MTRKRILVVDDEAKMRRVLEILIQNMGHEAICLGSGEDAFELLQSSSVDLILSDLRMSGISGVDLLRSIRAQNILTPYIVMTAYGTIESAIEAIKLGACEYILRPFDMDDLEITINRILADIRIRSQNDFLRLELDKGWGEFIGQSQLMTNVYELISQVAPSKTTVLITGETGTGKELVARAIHRNSNRNNGLFVPINCAAIPADILESEMFGYHKGAFTGATKDRVGKFEMADGGTLFLDELTEMPLALQAKLLRVLQESVIERLGGNHRTPVDVRVVAATNRDPKKAIEDGKLREDLYYRINVFKIDLPPLRSRKEDIPILVDSFIKKQTHQCQISQQVLTYLKNYDWPGNVRELENIIERAAVLSRNGLIEPKHLPQEITTTPVSKTTITPSYESLELNVAVNLLEQTLISEALRKTDNNKSKAARLLNISERSLWYKIKSYSLE